MPFRKLPSAHLKRSPDPGSADDLGSMGVLPRCLPFFLFMSVLVLRSTLGNEGVGVDAADARWLYALQAAVAILPILYWLSQYHELALAPRSGLSMMLSVTLGLALFLLWIAPMPAWMRMQRVLPSLVPVGEGGTLRWDLIAVRVGGAVLVVPLMEELFWRSFLLRWIDRRSFGTLAPASISLFAVLASSLVFGLAHELWLAGFLAGISYALLYRYTQNLWYPIVAHASTNCALAWWVVTRHAWQYW